jgi:hypothetical protein
VAGRHQFSNSDGGRRAVRTRLRVIAAVAAICAIVAGGWGGYRLLKGPSCSGHTRLSIAAAGEIAPAVRATTERWARTNSAVNGTCVSVEVTGADPGEVAAAIAAQHQSSLYGVGQTSNGVRVPDVWIPDSSTWLQRLRTVGPDWVGVYTPSVARSEVVLAMPEPAATLLGLLDKKLTWSEIFSTLAADTDTSPAGQQTRVKILRTLAAGRSTLRADLLARFPYSADPTTVASSLGAAPLSEQAVIAYNRGKRPVPLAALYVEPAPAPLDYPFAVLSGVSTDRRNAARAVLATLAGAGYRDDLAAVGLRAADGSVGPAFQTPRGAPAASGPVAAPDPVAVDRVLSTWTAITSPGRMLAVIDVSGSMKEPVPTAGGATREKVTVDSARAGLSLLDDTWAAGLWIFSTELDGRNDYRQLVPIQPLGVQRDELLRGLATIQPKENGGTGLYDTTLAAYKVVQDGWDASRVNSVVIMTDGRNEDPQGLSLDQLIDELKKTMDPVRPIQVIAIGIGDQVSEAELQRITSTTSGGTFIARDPAGMGAIILKAIALRTTIKR